MSVEPATIQSTGGSGTAIVSGRDAVTDFPPVRDLVTQDSGNLMWRQINEIVKASLTTRQPTPAESHEVGLVTLAPGLVVSTAEYKDRFDGIDLEQFRRQMSPEAFKAFVRHMGVIPGIPNLDVTVIADTLE